MLVLWIAAPNAALTAWLALAAGLLQFWRLGRWAGERTGPEPLVAILHIGYLFVPIGFVLLALGNPPPGHSFRVGCAARLDRGRRRNNDACGHDTGQPGSHRQAAHRVLAGAGDLCRCDFLSARQDRCRIWHRAGSHAASFRCSLDFCLCRLCHHLHTPARTAPRILISRPCGIRSCTRLFCWRGQFAAAPC